MNPQKLANAIVTAMNSTMPIDPNLKPQAYVFLGLAQMVSLLR